MSRSSLNFLEEEVAKSWLRDDPALQLPPPALGGGASEARLKTCLYRSINLTDHLPISIFMVKLTQSVKGLKTIATHCFVARDLEARARQLPV